jgi:hypothetical protein
LVLFSQVTSDAVVTVSLALPDWFPVMPALLEMAGSQTVQLVLDESLPRFLQRLVDAYAWWAGTAGPTSPLRVWRGSLRGTTTYHAGAISAGAQRSPPLLPVVCLRRCSLAETVSPTFCCE